MSKEQALDSLNASLISNYPKSKDVFKFNRELSRYALWIQEFQLRKELSDASVKSNILSKIGLEEFLSEDVKNNFISELAYILRYKRINDIFNDAANRGVTGSNQTKVNNILTNQQIDTLVKFSLDTPFILYHILRLNNFTDEYSTNEQNKNQRLTLKDGKLEIGQELKMKSMFGSNKSAGKTIYLNRDGNFVSGDEKYTPIGMGAKNMRRNWLKETLSKPSKLDLKKIEKDVDTTALLEKNMIKADHEEIIQMTNAVATVVSLAAGWWAFLTVPIGIGIWGTVKFFTDKHGLPQWSIDGYLLKLIDEHISKKLYEESTIYFHKQTKEEKNDLKKKSELFCQTKSKPNRKSLDDIKAELLKKGGQTQRRRQRSSFNKTARVTFD